MKTSLYLFYRKGFGMPFEKIKCKECGAIFQPKNKKQRFCSHKCAVKFNRRNNGIDVKWFSRKEV